MYGTGGFRKKLSEARAAVLLTGDWCCHKASSLASLDLPVPLWPHPPSPREGNQAGGEGSEQTASRLATGSLPPVAITARAFGTPGALFYETLPPPRQREELSHMLTLGTCDSSAHSRGVMPAPRPNAQKAAVSNQIRAHGPGAV